VIQMGIACGSVRTRLLEPNNVLKGDARNARALNTTVSPVIELKFSIYQILAPVLWSVFCPATELVAQIEFIEWTPDGHLRHSKFVGLREDKDARDVVRED
jgi:ATP-dependent DNA ligase